jgi:uncharacterized protein YoxC
VELSPFVNIAIAAGALAFAALCIYLIVVLKKMRESVVRIQNDISEVSKHAVPMFENLRLITDRVRTISENIDDQVAILRSSVESLRDMTENIVSFERDLQRDIEGPIMEAVSFVSAIVKAVKAFIRKLKD